MNVLDDYVEMSVRAVERARLEQIKAIEKEIAEIQKECVALCFGMAACALTIAYVLVGWWLS